MLLYKKGNARRWVLPFPVYIQAGYCQVMQ
nr:MAG TPA: hypothetical protein [Caudoviricetes sp.]